MTGHWDPAGWQWEVTRAGAQIIVLKMYTELLAQWKYRQKPQTGISPTSTKRDAWPPCFSVVAVCVFKTFLLYWDIAD